MADPNGCPQGVFVFDSHEADGKYFTLNPDGHIINFKPEAYLVEGAECLRHIDCNVGKRGSRSSCLHADYKTEHRDIILTWPSDLPSKDDFAFSPAIPIGDLIIEQSPSIGRQEVTTRAFTEPMITAGYGLNYVRIGIGKESFMAIWNRVNAFVRYEELHEWRHGQGSATFTSPKIWEDATAVDDANSCFAVPSLRFNHDHYWMLARSPDQVIVYNESGVASEADFCALTKKVGRNLKCDAIIKLELSRVDGKAKWELDVSLLSVAVLDTTWDKSVPVDAPNNEHRVGRNKRSTPAILKAFNECAIKNNDWASTS